MASHAACGVRDRGGRRALHPPSAFAAVLSRAATEPAGTLSDFSGGCKTLVAAAPGTIVPGAIGTVGETAGEELLNRGHGRQEVQTCSNRIFPPRPPCPPGWRA